MKEEERRCREVDDLCRRHFVAYFLQKLHVWFTDGEEGVLRTKEARRRCHREMGAVPVMPKPWAPSPLGYLTIRTAACLPDKGSDKPGKKQEETASEALAFLLYGGMAAHRGDIVQSILTPALAFVGRAMPGYTTRFYGPFTLEYLFTKTHGRSMDNAMFEALWRYCAHVGREALPCCLDEWPLSPADLGAFLGSLPQNAVAGALKPSAASAAAGAIAAVALGPASAGPLARCSGAASTTTSPAAPYTKPTAKQKKRADSVVPASGTRSPLTSASCRG